MKKTPEQQWDLIKGKLFKKGVPEEIENMMQVGFKEFPDDINKWACLGYMLGTIIEKWK